MEVEKKIKEIKDKFDNQTLKPWYIYGHYSDDKLSDEDREKLRKPDNEVSEDDKKTIVKTLGAKPLEDAIKAAKDYHVANFLEGGKADGAAISPVPTFPLTWSDELAKAARFHAINLAKELHADGDAHTGDKGSKFIERIKCFAKSVGSASENIAWNFDGKGQTQQLFIDAKVQGRGHQKNI